MPLIGPKTPTREVSLRLTGDFVHQPKTHLMRTVYAGTYGRLNHTRKRNSFSFQMSRGLSSAAKTNHHISLDDNPFLDDTELPSVPSSATLPDESSGTTQEDNKSSRPGKAYNAEVSGRLFLIAIN